MLGVDSMQKIVIVVLALLMIPSVMAVDTGSGIGIDINPEQFAPLIWMCDSRSIMDDCVEEGRISDCSNRLDERLQNYAFEGEQISWLVLVMDKNKVEQIQDVVGTLGPVQGEENGIEVECEETSGPMELPDS